MHKEKLVRNVFDDAAIGYLRDDEHWGSDLDVLKDAFNRCLSGSRWHISYRDIGCGPGFHTAAMKRMYPEASISGLDFSTEMLNIAKKNAPDIEFLLSDIVTDETPSPDFDVVSFLNNGFGNLFSTNFEATAVRALVMEKMRSLVRTDGFLVMSVYNLKKLTRSYGRKLRLLDKSDLDHGELFVEYRSCGKVVEYYSHWFTEKELVGLLEQNRFKVELLEERMARLVVKARAV